MIQTTSTKFEKGFCGLPREPELFIQLPCVLFFQEIITKVIFHVKIQVHINNYYECYFRNYLHPLCFVIDHPRAYKRGGLTLPNEQFAD